MSPIDKTHSRESHISVPTELESPLAFVEDGILTSKQPSPLITTVVADSCGWSQEECPYVLQMEV